MSTTVPQYWDRIRFQANEEDYRPVLWPPLGPYWCSGFGEGHAIVVAYVPHKTTDEELKLHWPEAKEIDRMQKMTDIQFTDRFQKPEWWPVRVGQPNETPLPGNVAWEHPRVKAASDELFAASAYHSKATLEYGFQNYAAACCRLENAAIAFANTVREYTLR